MDPIIPEAVVEGVRVILLRLVEMVARESS
jgi:hypothetical protein